MAVSEKIIMTTEAFEQKQQASGKLDGWYILEIFGHQKYAGYVTVEQLGIASMLRIDVPPLEERERETKRGGYDAEGRYIPPGTKVKEGAVQGYTKLFGVGAIYAMTPCTREACLAAVEQIQPRPMTPIALPENRALAAAANPDLESDDVDDYSDDEEEFEHSASDGLD